MRKLITFIGVIIVIGVGAFSYLSIKEIQQSQTSVWKTVPSDAQAIISINDPIEEWSKISANSVIWQALTDHGLLVEMGQVMDTIYAISNRNQQWRLDLNSSPLLVSFVEREDQWAYIASYALPIGTPESEIEKMLLEQGFILDLDVWHHKNWHLLVSKGLLLVTQSETLLAESKLLLNQEFDPAKPAHFGPAYSTANVSTSMNIFFTPLASKSAMAYFLGIPPSWSQFVANYGGITELDARIKPNALTLNGYSWNHQDSTGSNYLHQYSQQSGKKVDATDYLPETMSSFLHFNYSDYVDFRNKAMSSAETDFETVLANYSQQFEIDFKTNLLGWVEGEMVSGYWQRNPKSSPVFLGLIRTLDPEGTLAGLEILEAEKSRETYRELTIARIEHPEILHEIFGTGFSPLQPAHYTIIDDYVVFSTSIQNLKGYLNKILAEKTLKKNIHYDRFSDHLADHSNAFFYTNLARSLNVYKQFTDEKTFESLSDKQELLQLFEGLAWQMSHEGNDLYYNNIYFKHNPVSKQETYTLWETPLDEVMRSKPWIVKNHYTKSNEILVQDLNNRLYLIDGKGNILWRRDIGEQVNGTVAQVDVFRNNKLQMIFSTDHAIHLIDRLGRNVEGFPIKLKSKATNPVAVLDYDNDKNYRIIIACEDRNIYNFDRTGKKVKGWSCKVKSPIRSEIIHTAVKGKDYILAISENGSIHALSRKGKERLHLKTKMLVAKNSTYRYQKGKTTANSYLEYADSTGFVHRVTLSDKKTYSGGRIFSSALKFAAKDMDGNQIHDYVFVDSNVVRIFDNDFAPISTMTLDTNFMSTPSFYQFGGKGAHKIGFVDPLNEEIVLFNDLGVLVDGFPLTGASPFTIADINRDGQLELVVAGKDALVYAYALEDGD